MYKTTPAFLAAIAVGVHTVTYSKKDGDVVTRRLTRDMTLVPASPTGQDRRRDNGGYIPAWDMDAGKWTNVHPHNVIAISAA